MTVLNGQEGITHTLASYKYPDATVTAEYTQGFVQTLYPLGNSAANILAAYPLQDYDGELLFVCRIQVAAWGSKELQCS